MLRVSKLYRRSIWHYAFFLSLAILFLLSSSLFMSLNVDINPRLVSSTSDQSIHIKDTDSSDQVALLVRSSTSNGQLQALLQETVAETEKHKFVEENYSQIDYSPKTNHSSQMKHEIQYSPKSIQSQLNNSCDGRRIYMYNLPAEFNARILQQCDNKIAHWLNFCPHVVNYGFGRAVNDSVDWVDWYETDFYMLEVIFHARMALYLCRTLQAHEADAFFIPYYSGLDALHYLYGQRKTQRGEQGVELVRWLMQTEGGKYWRRRGGHDHFIVMGRTTWDFTRAPIVQKTKAEAWNLSAGGAEDEGGWGTSFAVLPEMENVTALFLERRPWQWLEQAIPYPTGFHPTSLYNLEAWQDKVVAAKRTFLLAFVGAPRPHESSSSELRRIRQAAIDQCLGNATACSLLDCSKMKCAHAPVLIAERLLDAHFCLQPPGDTATRRSTFDGLLSGCIPVFFNNDSAYTQYAWHLPMTDPSSYSVLVPAAELGSVLPLLSSFSVERIARMRSFIVEHLIPRIIYISPQLATSHPTLHDAFHLSLDGMLRRVAAN